MTDLREKQPETQSIDLESVTYGNNAYELDVVSWTYSGFKNEDVYSRITTFSVYANSFKEAQGLAQALAKTIESAHNIWKTNVTRVALV